MKHITNTTNGRYFLGPFCYAPTELSLYSSTCCYCTDTYSNYNLCPLRWPAGANIPLTAECQNIKLLGEKRCKPKTPQNVNTKRKECCKQPNTASTERMQTKHINTENTQRPERNAVIRARQWKQTSQSTTQMVDIPQPHKIKRGVQNISAQKTIRKKYCIARSHH